MVEFKRVYYPYWLWEDYKAGFFKSNCEHSKEEQIELSYKLFQNEREFRTQLHRLLKEWKHSLIHNLTNESLNKIAYLGQSACCIKYGISNDISREGFNLLTKEEKIKADDIAQEYLEKWETQYQKYLNGKNGQLNLFGDDYDY